MQGRMITIHQFWGIFLTAFGERNQLSGFPGKAASKSSNFSIIPAGFGRINFLFASATFLRIPWGRKDVIDIVDSISERFGGCELWWCPNGRKRRKKGGRYVR